MRRLDAFAKLPSELTEGTALGALLSMGCLGLMVCVVVTETYGFLATGPVKHRVGLNSANLDPTLRINLEMSFPEISCQDMQLRVSDQRGRSVLRSLAALERWHLARDGTRLFKHQVGAKKPSSATGCWLKGQGLTIGRVPTKLEILPPTYYAADLAIHPHNLTHALNHFSFGEPITKTQEYHLKKAKVEIPNGLEVTLEDAPKWYTSEKDEEAYHHHIHVVPAQYRVGSLRRRPLNSFQTIHHVHKSIYTESPPTVVFIVDVSPMMIVIETDLSKRWYDFLTNILATVGGTYSLAKYLNAFVERLN